MKKQLSLENFIKETLTKQLPVFYDKQVAIKRIAPIIVKEIGERTKCIYAHLAPKGGQCTYCGRIV